MGKIDAIAKHTERMIFHDWLKAHDKDYAFECAVMGEGATILKYTTEDMRRRTYEVNARDNFGG